MTVPTPNVAYLHGTRSHASQTKLTLAERITGFEPTHAWRRPAIIAEAGVNHEGSLDTARRLIDDACQAGADAIKFQTYKAGRLAMRVSPAYWDTSKEATTSQYELFSKYDAFWKTDYEALKKHCESAGIEFLSTPFDLESARFLDDLMDVYKISSSDLNNRPFIEALCDFGKPVILSTGASHLHEIQRAVGWLQAGGVPYALLHCVLNYPTDDGNANLGMIGDLKTHFPGVPIGYSDHTLPGDMKVLEVASLLGAVILEKHFTHDRSLPGNDHYHAMDKDDLGRLLISLDRIETLHGSDRKAPLPSERPAREHARRSLVAARAIAAGTVITAADLTYKRPASGIAPEHWHEVLGMRAQRDIEADVPLTWGLLEDAGS